MSIKIKNLKHIYNQGTPHELIALDDINLEIKQGEFIGLIGHTGSGKSTLVQHLNGLLRPSEGLIEVDDYIIKPGKQNLKGLRKKVGLVFQYPEYQLFEETIYKDIAFGPRNIGFSENEIEAIVKEAMFNVGLDYGLKDNAPFELSGGQKRKVAIAGVIAMKPNILVLDEPTAGLDPKSRDELLSYIKDLHEKEKMTIILVTHSMEEVARVASRLIVMHKAKVIYDDLPKVVFRYGDHLKEVGLDIPEVSKLVQRLRAKGFEIDEDILTLTEVKSALLAVLKE